jgi:MOSC domain-containing protein YiiM
MKLNSQSPLCRLMETFPLQGSLEWIGVRPFARAPVVQVDRVHALAGSGLEGDHRARSPGSRRQVTLIQREHLDVVAQLLRQTDIEPRLTRRNLVVSGINVLALKDSFFTIGEIVLEGTGTCDPCSRMETNLGTGGYNGMRGHGGITARIVSGGVLCRGDRVSYRGARALV